MALSVSLCVWMNLLLLYLPSVKAAIPNASSIIAQLEKEGACCTALDYFLPGKVFAKDSVNIQYTSSQASFWSAQEMSLQPTCIVIPTSTSDVSTAVTILSLGYRASINGCLFAVRGAGHTPQAGAANINDGVTIDMQSMNEVIVSADQKTVSVGPGNRWGNVYPTLDDLNLVMIGGRLSSVGVGGLVTGGGISFFSGRHGFACDNIKTYELVLGNGTVRTVNSQSYPDLFRALKGGNNNFGIVTRFDASLYSQTPFWGGTITQPITNKEAVFAFISNFTVSKTYDPYAALIANFAWVAGTPLMLHDIVYTNGDVTWPPPAYAPLDAMPKLTTTVRKANLSSFANEFAASAEATDGKNNMLTTLTFINKAGVAPDFMADVFDLADATAKELVGILGLIYTMTFQPLPHVLYSRYATSNSMGLDRFQDDLVNLLFVVSWELPEDNDTVYAALQNLEASIIAEAKDKGLYNEWLYLNYAAPWQDPISAYGSASVQFLQSVSEKYDPKGIFQKAVPGGFKLGI